MQDVTAVESRDGNTYIVEFDTETSAVVFLDENNAQVAEFALETLVAVDGGIFLNFGANLFVDATGLAGVVDFCRNSAGI